MGENMSCDCAERLLERARHSDAPQVDRCGRSLPTAEEVCETVHLVRKELARVVPADRLPSDFLHALASSFDAWGQFWDGDEPLRAEALEILVQAYLEFCADAEKRAILERALGIARGLVRDARRVYDEE